MYGCNGNLELLSKLLQDAVIKLYKSVQHSHCIHQLLLPVKFPAMKLRSSHCVTPSRSVNMNSINVPLCSEFCLMKPTDCLLYLYITAPYCSEQVLILPTSVCLSVCTKSKKLLIRNCMNKFIRLTEK